MIGGFALVAWPAEYGGSGVATLIVNHEASSTRRNLGPIRADRLSHGSLQSVRDLAHRQVTNGAFLGRSGLRRCSVRADEPAVLSGTSEH